MFCMKRSIIAATSFCVVGWRVASLLSKILLIYHVYVSQLYRANVNSFENYFTLTYIYSFNEEIKYNSYPKTLFYVLHIVVKLVSVV